MKALLVVAALILLALVALWYATTQMPGRSHRGALPPPTREQQALAQELRRDVVALAGPGPRNVVLPENLHAAARYIETQLAGAGYRVAKQTYTVEGVACDNLEVELRGTAKPGEIVIVGAHYDSVDDSPGADDNASGVAAMLALARRFAREQPARTIRFVAFANEEPPHFQTRAMGSYVYAKRSSERKEKIVAMLSLETMGYYTDAPQSQAYPPPLDAFYPSQGNFIAFAANLGSRSLARQCARTFRQHARMPSEGAALPELIPQIGWSDQWSFWLFGWPGIMVTDTAPFRNPNYHTRFDTPETLDYDRLARVVEGLVAVVREL